jgi:hypothetical protein
MPEKGNAHMYRTATVVNLRNMHEYIKTPGEAAVLSFIKARELEGRPGVTREELVKYSGLSLRTVSSATRALIKVHALY